MQLLVKFIADGTLLLVLAIATPVLLFALRKSFWLNAPVIVMAGLTSLLVGKVMSLLYQPSVARPFLEQGATPGAAYIDNPGFPSDHLLLATVATVAVIAMTRNRVLGVVLIVLVVAMGVGRMMALVHTPIDIIGGIVAGLAGAVWYRKLTK